MKLWKSVSATALVAALGSADPAMADVTAEQVWSSWKDLAGRSGQDLSGQEERSGDTLIVSDAKIAMDIDEGAAVTAEFGTIRFTERSDGTVVVRMAPEYPLSVKTVSAKGETVEMDMQVAQTGLDLVASGDAESIRYDIAAPQVSLTLTDMQVDGEPKDMALAMSAEGLEGSYLLSGGEMREVESDVTADAVRFDMAVTDPEQGVNMALRGEARNLTSTSASIVPAEMQTSDPAAMLASGFSSKGGLTYAGMSYMLDTQDEGQTTNVAITGGAGTVDFALIDGGMVYDVRSKDTKITVKGSEIPFPQIDLAMDDSAFKLQMPLTKTEEPADFALLTRIGGLTVSDAIWGMFDPTGQLPRDPATLVLDLDGKARWLVDITDPAMAQTAGTPGELSALNVKDLQLSLAGAELTGQGDFAFDNSDKLTFDGMPKPSGDLALKLEGGNALLDKLVDMGLIPQDQAMGFRMMLGMFARPGEGDDTLVSKISITEDGQIMANGQRLR